MAPEGSELLGCLCVGAVFAVGVAVCMVEDWWRDRRWRSEELRARCRRWLAEHDMARLQRRADARR